MKLFDRFDKVFLINLKKRPDRLENFKEQVKKHDLGDFKIVEAVDTTDKKIQDLNIHYSPGGYGLISTNIEILKESIKNNYETICIIEDDCIFNENISEIDNYYTFLPDNWDILYFGGNHNYKSGVPEPVVINERVIKLYHTYTTHFISIKKHMFQPMIDLFSTYAYPLDLMYITFQRENNVYSFKPGITSQQPGFSDVLGYDSNYLPYIS